MYISELQKSVIRKLDMKQVTNKARQITAHSKSDLYNKKSNTHI